MYQNLHVYNMKKPHCVYMNNQGKVFNPFGKLWKGHRVRRQNYGKITNSYERKCHEGHMERHNGSVTEFIWKAMEMSQNPNRKLRKVSNYEMYAKGRLRRYMSPVDIQTRKDPLFPWPCLSSKVTNGAVLQMRLQKPRPLVTAGVAR